MSKHGKLPGSWLVDGSDDPSVGCLVDSMLSSEDSMLALQNKTV